MISTMKITVYLNITAMYMYPYIVHSFTRELVSINYTLENS